MAVAPFRLLLPLLLGYGDAVHWANWFRRAPTVCNVKSFGAKGDGRTQDTAAIQAAIDKCASYPEGGVVQLPQGVYLSGALWLKSRVTFRLLKDTVLKAVAPGDWKTTWQDFPRTYVPDVCQLFGEFPHAALLNGGQCLQTSANPHAYGDQCLNWREVKDVVIEGEGLSSVLDGSGSGWHSSCGHSTTRTCPDGTAERWGRPKLLHMMKGEGVTIRNLHFRDAAYWNIATQYVDRVRISHVNVTAHPDSHNTDAYNIQSCKDVHIKDSYADTGDDCVAIYSGSQKQGLILGKTAENMLLERLHCKHGHGLAIGSRTATAIRNVTFRDIMLDGTIRGPRIKTCKGRGGDISQILFQNITMNNVKKAIEVTSHYSYDDNYPISESAGTPKIRDITIRGLHGTAKSMGEVEGMDGFPLRRLKLEEINLVAGDGLQVDPNTVVDSRFPTTIELIKVSKHSKKASSDGIIHLTENRGHARLRRQAQN
mmetsp:Transcript_112561/g.363572  ORF Transcript_112561/g.363572 Transcript_112561/m.363572 type:complete len:482 (-) Transcript_112561:145-1590(-)